MEQKIIDQKAEERKKGLMLQQAQQIEALEARHQKELEIAHTHYEKKIESFKQQFDREIFALRERQRMHLESVQKEHANQLK